MTTNVEMMDSGAISDWFEACPMNEAMRKQLTDCVRARLDTIDIKWSTCGAEVKMLDYACGNGFFSRVFAPYVTSIEAVDASAIMIEKYDERIDELGSIHKGTRAVLGDVLENPPQSVLKSGRYHDFHLITVGAALHHFADIGIAVQRLAHRLRPGGVLYIQDMLNNNDGATEDKKPRGFTSDEMGLLMSNAGLVNLRFEVLPGTIQIEVPIVGVLELQCFIASGTKGSSDG